MLTFKKKARYILEKEKIVINDKCLIYHFYLSNVQTYAFNNKKVLKFLSFILNKSNSSPLIIQKQTYLSYCAI